MILSVGGISRPPSSWRWNKHKGGYGHCHCAGVLLNWVLFTYVHICKWNLWWWCSDLMTNKQSSDPAPMPGKVKCLMHFLCFFLKFRHQIKANTCVIQVVGFKGDPWLSNSKGDISLNSISVAEHELFKGWSHRSNWKTL